MRSRNEALGELLAEPGVVIMPGVYDALSARLAEQAGFRVVNVGGAMIANAVYGMPDVGLTTLTEVADQVRRVVGATTIPVMVDGDTGYGNAINVMRAVREFETAGASCMKFEDQVSPKRCGHFAGKQVIEADEMVKKIEAALEARSRDDFLILARTDARAVLGLEAAIERAQLYERAGADMVFVESPFTVEELQEIPQHFTVPLMANMISGGGLSPLLTAAELGRMGYKLVNFGAASMQAAMFNVIGMYEELHRTGTTAGYLDRMVDFEERQRRVGLPEVLEYERRFATS